jgi:ectoine hydroxylase-related dioxygenase (phytanoyl-CoA dioxygenase family)
MHSQLGSLALRPSIELDGFAMVPGVLSESEIALLLECLANSSLRRTRAGIRHALAHPAVAALARDSRVNSIAREILGSAATPFRATLFDKSPESNWLVAWHQDTALPLRERSELAGWGPWSIKDGVNYAHAPAGALEQVLALRVHLDDSTEKNGPLRVLPGTHSHGVLGDKEIHQRAAQIPAVDCHVPLGGVLAMRPLLIHSSQKSKLALPRRVLHIEYAAKAVIADGLELAFA